MSDQSQFLLYTAPNGAVKVDVYFQNETALLTQKALAELFGVQVPAINKPLKNIFASGELQESAVISILETTAADGKSNTTTTLQISSFRPLRLLKNFILFLITPENGNSYNIIYNHAVTIT